MDEKSKATQSKEKKKINMAGTLKSLINKFNHNYRILNFKDKTRLK